MDVGTNPECSLPDSSRGLTSTCYFSNPFVADADWAEVRWERPKPLQDGCYPTQRVRNPRRHHWILVESGPIRKSSIKPRNRTRIMKERFIQAKEGTRVLADTAKDRGSRPVTSPQLCLMSPHCTRDPQRVASARATISFSSFCIERSYIVLGTGYPNTPAIYSRRMRYPRRSTD
jgi:hypothetical protein